MKQVIDNIFYHNYIKKLKSEKKIVRIWQIIILILFFTLWEVTSKFHVIDPLLFSSPSKVFLQIYHKLLDGTMMIHLQVTVFETVLGFILGTFIVVFIASILWSSERIARIADPFVVILYAMPIVALGLIIFVA